MNKRELEKFFDDVIQAERLERSLIVAAVERNAAAFSETRKQFQDLLCSLSNRARVEVGLPSIRDEARKAERPEAAPEESEENSG